MYESIKLTESKVIYLLVGTFKCAATRPESDYVITSCYIHKPRFHLKLLIWLLSLILHVFLFTFQKSTNVRMNFDGIFICQVCQESL